MKRHEITKDEIGEYAERSLASSYGGGHHNKDLSIKTNILTGKSGFIVSDKTADETKTFEIFDIDKAIECYNSI